MDKLELKHLAPYLPYGLKIEILNYKQDYTGIQHAIADGFYTIGGDPHITYVNGNTGKSLSEFKPILRPLSLLTKEIEHHGERFVPYDTNIFTKYRMNTLHPKHINIVSMPYWCVQKLIEWHFDVFGLIEKGLAVDATKVEGGI